MAEQITFDTAVDPPRTIFRITLLALDWLNQRIDVRLRDWDGIAFGPRELVPTPYTGNTAVTLMLMLNKANLSAQSLHQRVMARLQADGKIPSGTASGTPD